MALYPVGQENFVQQTESNGRKLDTGSEVSNGDQSRRGQVILCHLMSGKKSVTELEMLLSAR